MHDDELKVLLVPHQGAGLGWALPGTFVRPGERLSDAVLRSLHEKAGVSGRAPQQLHVFDAPGRDERGWVLSVAHVDVVPVVELVETQAQVVELVPAAKLVVVVEFVPAAKLVPVVELAPVVELVETPETRNHTLPYDHAQIIGFAVSHVRSQYRASPDPSGLLTPPFTLKELRELHEAVLGESLLRDTFRRAMEPLLVATGEISDGAKGRPAALFTGR